MIPPLAFDQISNEERFMNRLSVGLAAVVMFVGSALGDDFKPEPGYVSLFNGKDLTGWQYPGKKGEALDGKMETADKRFEVKDGIIVANAKDSAGKGGIRDLFTIKEFDKNFNLKLEFRAGPKADSGVYIRGPQLQVRDFIRRNEQKQLTKFKNDDWNELDITVTGTEAVCKLNGEMLGTMKVPAKGPIGLQAESGKFEFRRIRIKEAR
jgi:3-keto-disaccharide hydrolase